MAPLKLVDGDEARHQPKRTAKRSGGERGKGKGGFRGLDKGPGGGRMVGNREYERGDETKQPWG